MKDKQNQFNAQQQSAQTASNLSPPLSESRYHQDNGFQGSVYLSEFVEQRSHFLVRLLGYSLLVFALINYIYILTPLHFTDPVWELQTIGVLVDHIIAPLLGLMFVFYRQQSYIKKLEKNILGLLSWVSLLVGVLYLLMLPLGVADTWRIYYANDAQISALVSQQSQQFQPIKEKLNQATTNEQIEKLISSPQGRPPQLKNPQALKDQLLSGISEAEQKINIQADNLQTSQRQNLIKDCVKWNLGALLAGTVFIRIWHLTDWARIREW